MPYAGILYFSASNEKDSSNELNKNIARKSNIFLNEIVSKFDFPAELVKLDSMEFTLYQTSVKSIVEKLIIDGEILKYNDNEVFSYNRKKVMRVANSIEICDTILNIIKQKDKRLMLSTGTLGFIKTKDYRSNNPKSRVYNYPNSGAAYVLLDRLFNNPKKCCKSINYALIIDSEEKNIAYFNIAVEEINPASDESLQRMAYRVFEDYWIWYHPEAQQYLKIKQK